MIISNYNSERAENSKRKNDATIKKIHKFERTAFCVKSILLIIMNLCIIAMSCCVLMVLVFHSQEISNLTLFAMVVFVAISMLIVAILMPYRKKPKTPKDYYDNIETKYHRLINKYKKVLVKTDESNDVICICEDNDRTVTAYKLHPAQICKSNSVSDIILDVEHDCLLIPN